jgi:proline iminopeptidase
MKELYPSIEPFNSGFIDVGSNHKIYFEESGNKDGIPVIRIHGGPGSNTKPKHRQMYNPEKYRIICFDQRGCGQSKFKDLLLDNTTQDTISDIEKIREYLGIEKWVVNGGSWGSLLAILYSMNHPESVMALLVSGIFFGKTDDVFAYQKGANNVFTEEHLNLLKFFSATSENIFEKMNERIFQDDFNSAYLAASEMFKYEVSLMSLLPQEKEEEVINEEIKKATINSGKIYLHYSNNNYFIPGDFIINNVNKIKDIPTTIIQGRYDMVCPYKNAYLLSQELPNAKLITIIAGHYYSEPENIDILLQAHEDIADKILRNQS